MKDNIIFLHAGWRSSSTYIWSKFRDKDPAYCYYEPFHEMGASYSPELIASVSDSSWTSRHPKMDNPYSVEYLPLLTDSGLARYSEDFAVARYFNNDGSAAEVEFLSGLVEFARERQKIPVFGFTRSLGRVGCIKKALGGVHVVQMRDPFEQWLSCRSYRIDDNALYFELCHFLILGLAKKFKLAAELTVYFSIPEPAGDTVSQQLEYMQSRYPVLDDELSYKVFLAVYVLSYLRALPWADLIIDMECLDYSVEYKKAVSTYLLMQSDLNVEFDDCGYEKREKVEVGFDVESVTFEVFQKVVEYVSLSECLNPNAFALLNNKLSSMAVLNKGVRPGIVKRLRSLLNK